MARAKSSNRSPWLLVCCVALIAGLIVGGVVLLQPPAVKLTLEPIARQSIAENETLKVKPVTQLVGAPANTLRYGLISGPPGATINPKTGVFTWKPTEDQGPKTYKAELGVKTTGTVKAQASSKFSIVVKEVNDPPVILDVGNQTVTAGETLTVVVRGTDPDDPAQEIEYRFGSSVPAGARLDPKTGAMEWTAPGSSKEHDETVHVIVAETGAKAALQSEVTFQIHVKALESAADRLAAVLKESGLTVEKAGGEAPAGFGGQQRGYDVNGQTLTVLEYETAAAAEADLKQISKDGGTMFGQPQKWSATTRIYQSGPLIALFSGTDATLLKLLETQLAKPAITAEPRSTMPEKKVAVQTSASGSLGTDLADLQKAKKLLNRKEYPAIRKLFARQFEQLHAEQLQQSFEGEGADLKKWFDEHPEQLEEFYTALVPEDDLPKTLEILIALHKKFPRQLEDYFPLATAVAVTWDNEEGVYDYEHHSRRTHSIYPDDLLGALENFEFFLDTEKVMQGRAQFLPWEFLKHMVNHRTPRKEREWALQNYATKRVGFGKCYADVPYDKEMLRTESEVCKMDGKDYILPNLLTLGGVCAQQADYASRVGKSIGVPAEYVRGQGRFGGWHAWVMWVELKQVTKTGIVFSLESHGRYFDDNYYVGLIDDPQSGKETTDRELELRLHAVGMDTVAFRQTKLIMSAYPALRDAMAWNASEEIIFLNDVIELCPGNEQAWLAVAKLARDGKIETSSYRLINTMFDKLFRTYANFPDFTWKVFDDLVSFQKNTKQRNRYFERLVQLYEAAGRPDLSCEARILLSDYLLEEGKTKEVLAGLAYTIKKFPDEGVFVPKLLDKLEASAGDIKGSEPQILQLYQELLSLIPPRRGDSPSDFYMQMLKRAGARFEAAGQLQQAQAYAAELQKMKGAK